jgi:hypothetical protein
MHARQAVDLKIQEAGGQDIAMEVDPGEVWIVSVMRIGTIVGVESNGEDTAGLGRDGDFAIGDGDGRRREDDGSVVEDGAHR